MSVTTQQKPTNEREVLRTQLNRMSGEFKMALPSHITPEKFARVVLTAVQQTPELMEADRRTLLMAATKCAQDGLLPDGREAAFVIFNTKTKTPQGEKWVKAVAYMPMIAGILKRVRNGGVVSSLQAHTIYENDHFVWKQGTEDSLEHVPLFPGDRGQVIGAYAVARFKDGSPPMFRVMDRNRIEQARAVSKSKDGPAWRGFYDEMAQKTVARNLAKYLPADAEIESVARRDDEAPSLDESTTSIDAVLTEDQRSLPAPSRLDALEGAVDIDEDGVVTNGSGHSNGNGNGNGADNVTPILDQFRAAQTEHAILQLERNAAIRAQIAKLRPEDRAACLAEIDEMKADKKRRAAAQDHPDGGPIIAGEQYTTAG